MYQKLRELILRDVKNENEIQMYAVVLRSDLLIMLLYYVLVFSAVLWQRHWGAAGVNLAGAVMCAVLFVNTYRDRTMLISYVFNISFAVLVFASALLYGNSSNVYNFIYLQIVLLFVLDYLSNKLKWLYTVALILFRIGIFWYMEGSVPVYALTKEWALPLQCLQMITSSLLFLTTMSISTQDFREMHKKLVSYNKKLQNIASIDPLTGLQNRRSAMDYIQEKAEKYRKGESNSLTIAIGDIDFFKRINDTYGHHCGDVVLKELAEIFAQFMKGKGRAIRWGGEEFLFVFYDINGDDTSYMLSQLRSIIHQVDFTFQDVRTNVTMTFGVAEYDLRRTADDIINEADEKLYIGKERGRDIIIY